jgi:parallel beta-helix repeat protein
VLFSGVVTKRTALTLTLILVLLFPVVAGMFLVNLTGGGGLIILPSEVAYIRNDGTVYPSDTPIQKSGSTYVFNDDLYNHTLVVQCDNIIIDGAGFTLSSGDAREGITLSNQNEVTIRNLNITGFSFVGIHVENSSHINIFQNDFSKNYYAMRFEHSSHSNISKNTLTNSGINTGVCLINSESITISENYVANSYTGMEIWDSRSNEISRNNITSNQRGVLLSASANIMYFHNNFIDNAVSIAIINSDASYTNFADNGKEGNYWSDYTGKDVNGDGIGDTPYLIDAYNKDNYPLMFPFETPPSPTQYPYPTPTPSKDPASTPEPQPEEPFPTTLVVTASVASVAFVSMGLVVYFKKCKNAKN